MFLSVWQLQSFCLQEYLECAKKFYKAGLEEVNFKTATEETRQLINSWVEKETNGKHWKMGTRYFPLLTIIYTLVFLSSQCLEKVGQARVGCILLWKHSSTKWHPWPACPSLQAFVHSRGGVSYHSLPCFFLKGRIQDFLVSGSVDLHTVLVLVNAICFKGVWKTAFKGDDTQEVPFNVTEVGGHGHSFWPGQLLAHTASGLAVIYTTHCCHRLGDLAGSLTVSTGA